MAKYILKNINVGRSRWSDQLKRNFQANKVWTLSYIIRVLLASSGENWYYTFRPLFSLEVMFILSPQLLRLFCLFV